VNEISLVLAWSLKSPSAEMKFFLRCFFVVLLSSCYSEDDIVIEKKKIITDVNDPDNNPQSIYFITGDSLFKAISNKTIAKKLATDVGLRTELAISPDHSKVAYVNSNDDVVVIDSAGSVLNTYSFPTYGSKLKWAYNNTSLYCIASNQVEFIGGAFTHPPITTSGIYVNLINVEIYSSNLVAYIYESSSGFTNNGYLRVKSNTASILSDDNTGYAPWDNLRLSEDGNSMFYTDYSGNILKINLATGNSLLMIESFWIDNYFFSYNSNRDEILVAVGDNSSGWSEDHFLFVYNKTNPGYNRTVSPIFISPITAIAW